MGLVSRYNNSTYFYRTVKTSRGPRNIYIACGERAVAIASEERALRSALNDLKARQAALAGRLQDIDSETERCHLVIADWHEDLMRALGWHRHQRTWRPSRVSKATLDNPAICQAFEHLPERLTIRSDIVLSTVQRLCRRITGEDATTAAEFFVRFIRLRDEIAGRNATPLERLLSEDVAVCWLASKEADVMADRFSHHIESRIPDLLDRRAERAHRRFLASSVALARVRASALPRLDATDLVRRINELVDGREIRHGQTAQTKDEVDAGVRGKAGGDDDGAGGIREPISGTPEVDTTEATNTREGSDRRQAAPGMETEAALHQAGSTLDRANAREGPRSRHRRAVKAEGSTGARGVGS